MKLHPRHHQVTAAERELEAAVWKITEQHDLTYIELARALNNIQSRALTYALRIERHPDDPDKKADEA